MRLKLDDADRERYGGPEWLDIEDVIAWSTTAGYDELADAEKQITAFLGDPTKSLTWVVAQFLQENRTATLIPMQRVQIWLCLVATGSKIKLDDCVPRVLAVEIYQPPKKTDGDADPPSPGADSSTDTAAEASPESQTSTGASTPGSPSTSD